MSTDEFCSRLKKFFLQLLRDFRYAVEVRNPGLLGMSYLQVLSFPRCRACLQPLVLHAAPLEQHTRMQAFIAVFTVLSLLKPLKVSTVSDEPAKNRASPYTKIVEAYYK